MRPVSKNRVISPKNRVHRTLIDLKNMSRLEKPRNIAQKRRYREHEFGGLAAVRRANRDPIATNLHLGHSLKSW